jgi:probable phosphoglycerate mutase
MSSLHCPARVLIARHGEAEYETEVCSDDGGSLTPLGRGQARALAERLRGERVARVWTSSLSRAVQTAEIVAAGLGVDVVVREGLREYGVGALAGSAGDEKDYFEGVFRLWAGGDDAAQVAGGERIVDFVDRVQGVLDEVADTHPGEAALVVSHGGAILATVPQLVGLPRTRGLGITLANCALIELAKDADGWRLVGGLDSEQSGVTEGSLP